MADRLPRLTARQVLRALQRDGWVRTRKGGSHWALTHPNKPGAVTVPEHAGMTIGPRLLASIIRQAGLTSDEFTNLL